MDATTRLALAQTAAFAASDYDLAALAMLARSGVRALRLDSRIPLAVRLKVSRSAWTQETARAEVLRLAA